MIPENYFDLWNIFVNEVVGNTTLFIIIGLIIITYITIKYGIPTEAIILILVLFCLITLSQVLGGSYLMFFAFIGIIVGGFFALMLAKRI